MNILVVCNYDLYQNLSYSFVHNLIREYTKLGHRVRVIIPVAMGKRARNGKRFDRPILISQADGVEMYDLRFPSLGKYGRKRFNLVSLFATVRVLRRKLLKDFSPDVIHAHTFGADSELGAVLKKMLGCPLVVTTHGGDTNIPLANGQHELLKAYCDRADVVAAVSSKLKKGLESCNPKTEIRLMYNGFNLRPYPDKCAKDPNAIIQVGNLIPSKRVDVTIRALAKLRERDADLTLTVIGQGPLRGELEALCGQLGVSEFVRFLGAKPNDEVFQKMCESSIFVMASKPEGFGIVYLEAMNAGCVAIGTETEGIADVIENSVNGFLVPADDVDAVVNVVEKIMADPAAAEKIAARGKELVQKMTWADSACQYDALFQELINEQAKR